MVGASPQARPQIIIPPPHSPYPRHIPAPRTTPSPSTAPKITARAPQFTCPVFVRRVCVLPIRTPRSIHSHSCYHDPHPNSPRSRLSLPCPPHKTPPQAHFVRLVIRFPSFRFACTLHSSLAYIHRIPYTFSPKPEPQAPARCACRGGCDRLIAFSTVRQLVTTS